MVPKSYIIHCRTINNGNRYSHLSNLFHLIDRLHWDSPLSWFPERARCVNFDSRPRDSGMVPGKIWVCEGRFDQHKSILQFRSDFGKDVMSVIYHNWLIFINGWQLPGAGRIFPSHMNRVSLLPLFSLILGHTLIVPLHTPARRLLEEGCTKFQISN